MLPALQPSRLKHPHHPPPRRNYMYQQQTRTVHDPAAAATSDASPVPAPATNPPSSPPSNPYAPSPTLASPPPQRPRSQIEAMPPFAPAPARAPTQAQAHAFPPPHMLYNSATRHPVFFTETLRKPPFPIPRLAAQAWNPVASGYIFEGGKSREGDGEGGSRGKL
ncbi:hypothetical protein P154DRAFT_475986 [Amniculicola lignicola CBS 123094]|uniref:Uncharacterized protein n=1 Tax=Amniculicola lignicola CBS 123094 TaxID=1392246 RepID=A0A6A5VXG7_9PLEO|nr:hypothetical protein P154DRAFT_475986 [Amniculicola lignicola CBS 123094]